MRNWSKGLKDGNRPVGGRDIFTLKHVKYDPTTNTVDVDRAMRSTLNSYLLDNQHKISSGAENIFYTNLESDVDWYPMWGGIKDQSKPENRGSSGVYRPSGRTYSDLYIIEPYGPPTALNGAVAYSKPASMLGNHSVYGQEIIVAEDVAEDDYIIYQLYYGQDNTGRLAYEQKLTGNELRDGDELKWWFTHPAEGHVGTSIYTTVLLVKGQEDVNESARPLLVRPSSIDPLNHYSKIYLRVFEDKELAFKDDISSHIDTDGLLGKHEWSEAIDGNNHTTLHDLDLQWLTDDNGSPLQWNNYHNSLGTTDLCIADLTKSDTLHDGDNQLITDEHGMPLLWE